MSARRILIPFHDFARGGTERVAQVLAQHWLDAGREVTILCGSRGGGTIDRADPRIRVVELDPELPRSPLSRLRLGPAMAARLPELAPDVVFIPGNFHFVVGRAFRKAMPGLPLVAKVSNPLLPPLPRPLAAIARAGLAVYCAPLTTLVYMAPELAEAGCADLPGTPAEVIAEPNLPVGHEPLPRHAPGGDPVILVIARLEPQKNLGLALEAFAGLLRRRPARLSILGEGAERARLEAHARSLGIAEHVDLPGYVTDIPQRLAGASALLLSSRYEGYPAVVVEALAADVPVVTTDCSPSLAGLIDRPSRGEVVARDCPQALAEALGRALDLPFASGGERPAAVAHHDAAASAAAYLALFDRLAAARP
ncbi:glycosyltransferase [Novosphingobium flavum]|uniref:Glycosyltransferase n=1 Tax=Novosphingobium flavum TaxID=1778672 RepID=A0A7X1FQ23_9SPHN|nr:glycosyltransferase [Novosphingobium flavum]MBC2664793.1 glycosyltransferase [Novosphingobium flavum]